MPAPDLAFDDGLLAAGFGSASIAALVDWPARVEAMLEVERALAVAQARLGMIPAAAATAITNACDAETLDLQELAVAASRSATPVIPLLHAVSARAGKEATAYLHYGATSQDVIDTAMVLQLRRSLRVLMADLAAVADQAAELARKHRDDVAVGRTLVQHAGPITIGLRAARWLAAVDRRRAQLAHVGSTLEVLQLGGVVGTMATYGDQGQRLVEVVASELELGVPELPWHAERDRIVDLAGALAAIASVVGKLAQDVVLLSATELAEVRERSGGPTSSAAPHKQNPVDAMAARAAARLALGEVSVLLHASGEHELERAAGAWQAEWIALPSLLVRVGGAVERLRDAFVGLRVDPAAAERHLGAAHGLARSEVLAGVLTPALGRAAAQRLVASLASRAVNQGRSLMDVATEDPRVAEVLDDQGLKEALDLRSGVRSAGAFIDRVLARHAAVGQASEVSAAPSGGVRGTDDRR
jgi:3-carboxy-cis,cis-muconate cycloisomerase